MESLSESLTQPVGGGTKLVGLSVQNGHLGYTWADFFVVGGIILNWIGF